MKNKSKLMLIIETKLQEPMGKFLKIEYEDRGLTIRQISEKLYTLTGEKVSYITISRWLKFVGLKAREVTWI